MIVTMKLQATAEEGEALCRRVGELGGSLRSVRKDTHVVSGLRDDRGLAIAALQSMPGVLSVCPVKAPYQLASREYQAHDTVFPVRGVEIGGDRFTTIAGPCSVESESQILETARAVARAGAQFLRGGAFKPRTSPYEFQGLALDGLRMLEMARRETGLGIVTEVMSVTDVPVVAEFADILQVGARNMQNFPLLTEVGRSGKPVLLKRGLCATIHEFLMSAEYICAQGNSRVILCERGIRGADAAHTRNVCDIAAIPVLQELTHLPVFLDPSHATGKRRLVPALARAGVAIGANGMMVEVHPNPDEALSDGPQSLTLGGFAEMMQDLGPYLELWSGRRSALWEPVPA